MQNSIYQEANGICVFTVQLMTCLTALSASHNQSDYSILLQLLFVVQRLEDRLKNLLNSFETLYYLLNTLELNETSQKKLRTSFHVEKSKNVLDSVDIIQRLLYGIHLILKRKLFSEKLENS